MTVGDTVFMLRQRRVDSFFCAESRDANIPLKPSLNVDIRSFSLTLLISLLPLSSNYYPCFILSVLFL